MKKMILTFFVACNLAISGFFAVLATSPALAAECPLCEVAPINNVAKVRRLLDDGANPNQVNAVGNTALIIATIVGHSRIVKALLDGGANPNQAGANDLTALMYATRTGNILIVKALLDGGANPNQARADGSTALTYAVDQYRVNIVKMLSDPSDSSWLFTTCTTDEMTDDKKCFASSHPVTFSATNAASIGYFRNCTTRFDRVGVHFNLPQSYDINEQNIRSLSFLVRGDDKRPAQMQFSTSNLFRSKLVAFDDSAEAVALIKRSNNVRIRFPFRRGSEVIKFPMNGATAAIEKARKECRK